MNYADMRAQFQGILNRSDCPDDLAKTFFDQTAARCNRELRSPNMEFIMSVDTSAGAVTEVLVPGDWLENIAFVVTLADGLNIELQYLDLGSFLRRQNQGLTDPCFYTRKYNNWLVTGEIPSGAAAYVYYYGELGQLLLDADEPVIAKIAPDLLIYGALTYAADYFIDDRGAGWEAKFQDFKAALMEQSAEGENQDGTNAIQPAYTYDDCV